MKIKGDFLITLGMLPDSYFGRLLKIINTNGDFTEQGIRQICEGFLSGKLPKKINTCHGDCPASLDLMKVFFDYKEEKEKKNIQLRNENLPFNIFGKEHIEQGAIDQMITAMRLPVAVAGALSSDAHQGYSLPIGGILATANQVIPNAVGVDISCFPPETRVAMLDGTQKSFKELTNEIESFWVYSINNSGMIVPAKAKAFKVKENASLVSVRISGGEEIVCTPDHLFMLRDGRYKEAQNLVYKDSLMPFYRSYSDRDGYEYIYQPNVKKTQRTHSFVSEIYNGKLEKGFVIHHANGNQYDNRPENLRIMSTKDHSSLHAKERIDFLRSKEFKNNRIKKLKKDGFYDQRFKAKKQSIARENSLKFQKEHPVEFKEIVSGNGQRGKKYLKEFLQTERASVIRKEIANKLRACDICGELVKSNIGLYNHKKHKHNNHKVISVNKIDRKSDVFCLEVEDFHNFALASGVFVHNCSMKMSVFEGVSFPERNNAFRMKMKDALQKQTCFGVGLNEKKGLIPSGFETTVLESSLWTDIPMLKKYNIKKLAENQIGTSGSGNHFVDFGTLTEMIDGDIPNLALLSHSGSRGVGYKIAKLYHELACENFDNKDFHGWAWLDLDTDSGKEYWAAMELCAAFARVSHEMIHYRISKFLGLSPSYTVFTNHNFAWKEKHIINGKEMDVIVHRKGAVQAQLNQEALIGGSMGTPSYYVKGNGNEASLCSCSHGSGRTMSRKQAKETFSKKEMQEFLNAKGVELLDGGLDECPMAYKDVAGVMDAQKDLVGICGIFQPKIVMMSDDPDND